MYSRNSATWQCLWLFSRTQRFGMAHHWWFPSHHVKKYKYFLPVQLTVACSWLSNKSEGTTTLIRFLHSTKHAFSHLSYSLWPLCSVCNQTFPHHWKKASKEGPIIGVLAVYERSVFGAQHGKSSTCCIWEGSQISSLATICKASIPDTRWKKT